MLVRVFSVTVGPIIKVMQVLLQGNIVNTIAQVSKLPEGLSENIPEARISTLYSRNYQ